MAKGDIWRSSGTYKKRSEAKKAQKFLGKGYRVSKAKGGKGWTLSRLWTPVKGQKDFWGSQLFRPKK